jgi:hypothetical protein
MKNTTVLTLLLITFSVAACSCCKKNDEPTADNTYGLPNATQEGKNTFGFLLNGEPWTPKGQVGVSANLAVNVDFGYKKGVFGITAYRYFSATNQDNFGIGISDSLNFYTPPFSLPINKVGICRLLYSNGICNFFNTDNSSYSEGTITINKLDKILQIISGKFEVKIYSQGCDTIKITEGRFDMKY